MKLGYFKLKARAGVGFKIICPYGMFDQSDQSIQLEYFSHLDPPYQQ
jgi:hypothetical protein